MPRRWIFIYFESDHYAKRKTELIMNELKIMCMKMKYLVFFDSVSFLPRPMRNLHEAFGMTACKAWYSHYFYTDENGNYFGPIRNVSYYGVNEMGDGER